MFTLCWIAFYAIVKNFLAWCEHKWPKTAAIFLLESNPRFSLLTSVSFPFSVHTTQESVTKTYPICDDSLSRPKQRSIALAQNTIRNWCFVCERKPFPTRFWYWRALPQEPFWYSGAMIDGLNLWRIEVDISDERRIPRKRLDCAPPVTCFIAVL